MERGGEQWTVWFDQYAPALVLFAQQITGQRSDAEDVVQEGFVRFWRHRQEADDPAAYLYACVKRCALDHLRGSKRRRQREQRVSRSRDECCLVELGEQTDRRLAIERGLRILPEDQRQVVMMKIWGGLTFGQIATALELSPNTAASRYRYALKRMREHLDEAQDP
jgi:RNA polymerase sigma-70 factor (ECF subfamily)